VPGFPSAPVNANNTANDHRNALHHSAPAHISWARLLKQVFDIDIDKPDTGTYRCQLLRMEQCPQCGGSLTIIAAILDPTVIAKILTHLGLSARAPPRSPARHFALIQTA
jgi:hypothetical protein